MRYKDLVEFEPINTVIQLTDANDTDKARKLLETYVISDTMSETITEVVFNHLQFMNPADNKSLLIVGNYGSGKSHLMSVISAIAEYKEVSKYIQNKNVANKAKEIEGQFDVIRFEIGGVNRSLKDILISQLIKKFDELDLIYEFPKDDSNLTNNKEWLLEMMEVYNEKYDQKGLLVVVDELLDFLRSRNELEMTLDLGFLREIGELAQNSRFRFIAGIQEMLFDNPRFSYVADSLRRVKERFEQVRIVKEDIAFVVSERLLKKNDYQKAKIREHLLSFSVFYDGLSENLEKYVELFPIHPSYLTAFEKVRNIEKRVALRTITNEINKIIEEEVPSDNPGLITYDSYWIYIEEDPSNKTIPEVREVIEKSSIIKDRINSGFPIQHKKYKGMAISIINALALNRLMMDDIYSEMGMSSNELKNDLFLMIPGQKEFLLEDSEPADFLKSNIDLTVKLVMETVSYQYISINELNGQYFLDLKKDIDVESLIKNRADIIGQDTLDRYYFDLLQNSIVLNETYVPNYKVWTHELPWEKRRVMRKGYLFFGSPNERSTAQPEQDFYIYMLRPYNKITFIDEKKSDEVFFKLNINDEFFTNTLRKYAAAREQYNETTQAQKKLFKNKYDSYYKQLNQWLNENFGKVFTIIYMGEEIHIGKFKRDLATEDNLKGLINSISSNLLSNDFEKKYEGYPAFNKFKNGYITSRNIKEVASEALQYLNNRHSTTGYAILDGLVMFNPNDEVTNDSIANSGYSRMILDLLDNKGINKAINNNEIFVSSGLKGPTTRKLSKKYKLEPELIVVVMGALLYSGKIEINVAGKNYTAMDFRDFISSDIEKLSNFEYIKKPTELPVSEIDSVLNMFGESIPNFNENLLERYIKRLNQKTIDEISYVLETIQLVNNGFSISNFEMIDGKSKQIYIEQLKSYKVFCEDIQRYNSVAKMKNFPFNHDEINKQQSNKHLLESINQMKRNIDEISRLVQYIKEAGYNYGLDTDWSIKSNKLIEELINEVKTGNNFDKELNNLKVMKKEYIAYYYDIHQKSQLTSKEENIKNNLLGSAEYNLLESLSKEISIIPSQQLVDWVNKVSSTQACYFLTKSELNTSPTCKHCQFEIGKSNRQSKKVIAFAKEDLNKLYENWLEILITELEHSKVAESISLLRGKEKNEIENFIDTRKLDYPISNTFFKNINNLFKGFKKIELTSLDIINSLGDGSPMTVHEFDEKFKTMILDIAGGNDEENLRIIFKE